MKQIKNQRFTPKVPEDHMVLIGSRDNRRDLQSEAEKNGRFPYNSDINELAKVHSQKNIKSREEMYSPFVSTTSDIEKLVSASLSGGPAGDPNLRNEVLEVANFVSIFVVPKKFCFEITEESTTETTPGIAEKEVLFQTAKYNSLTKYRQNVDFPNPFAGQIVTNLQKMGDRRNVDESIKRKIEQIKENYDNIKKIFKLMMKL